MSGNRHSEFTVVREFKDEELMHVERARSELEKALRECREQIVKIQSLLRNMQSKDTAQDN